jgi:cell fate (sporulation/competence/biofilm development) regulator YlbF (YheA/YmcA/DUF963 family)
MEKAQELGRLVGQSEEFKALHRAREALDGEQELKVKSERLQTLAAELEQRVAEGNEPESSDAEEYNGLLSEIQAHPRYQQLVAAQSNFDKLMLQVQDQILDGMQKGAASPIITLG